MTQLLLIGIVSAHGHLEKVTESGTTVGEIRSRELSGVGTPSYSAFAYGPGSGAINGDIWYVPSYGEQMDEGSFNYYTALHEIGHAVGLSHPFDGGGRGGTTLEMVRILFEIP